MTPVIRVDDEVMEALNKRALNLGNAFVTPNDILKKVLGLEVNKIEVHREHSTRKIRIPFPKTGEILEFSSGAEACRYLGLAVNGNSANRVLASNGYKVEKV